MINNKTLCKFFETNLIELGMEIDELDRHEHLGSSDIGNVSYVVPAIQPLISVGENPQISVMSAMLSQQYSL
jgi:hypothetical protein